MTQAQHAYVDGGEVVVMTDGRWVKDSGIAWGEWLTASASPIPSTRQRAAEIRAALDAVGFLKERIAA